MNTPRITRHRYGLAAALTAGLAVAAWVGALVPAQAQVEAPAPPAVPTVPLPPAPEPVNDAVDGATETVGGVIDDANGAIDQVEDTVNGTIGDVVGRLPELPVDVPTIDLPRIPNPIDDDPVGTPVERDPEGKPAPPPGGGERPSPVRHPVVDGSRTSSAPVGSDPGWTGHASPADGSLAGQTPGRGPDGFPIGGRPIAHRGAAGALAPGEALADAADGLPQWLALAAAGLLSLVSSGLAVAAYRKARALAAATGGIPALATA